MSVSVISPFVSTDFYKLKTRKTLKPQKPSTGTVAKLKKNLFGVVDREANKKFVAEELARQQKKASEKWGFDFMSGVPLETQTEIEWTCTITPAVYTLTHAAHVIENFDEGNDLLDERAEKTDFYLHHCDISSPNTTNNTSASDTLSQSPESRTGRTSYHLRKLSSNIKVDKRQPKITDFLKEKKKSVVTSATKKTTPLSKSRSDLPSTSAASLRFTLTQ